MKTNRCLRAGIFIFILFGITFNTYVLNAETEDACATISDKISHGQILWTENAIAVQGTAAPNLSSPDKPIAAIKREAQRAALLDAYRRVAEVMAGVHISSNTLVADRPEVVTRLNAHVNNPRICQTKYYADGGVDIVIMVPLKGKLLRALLSTAGSKVATSKSPFTGLIVDATHLTFTPSIAPQFLAPDGTVVFSQKNVKLEVLTNSGAVKYFNDKKEIQKELIGNNPLEIKPVALGSLSPCDVVLNEKDAAELAKQPSFLGNGKVAVIIPSFSTIDCQDLSLSDTDKRIDWERKLLLAKGTGKASFSGKEDESVRLRMMERAAEVDARKKLLESILSLKVDSSHTLSEIPDAKNILNGVVRNAVRCNSKYYRDGTAEIVMAVPIDGLTAKAGRLGRSNTAPVPNAEASKATGLIVEASGLSFEPVLSPVIVTSRGDIIYNHEKVAADWIEKHGVVGYRSSTIEAKSDSRIGNHPFLIKAGKYDSQSNRLILEPIDEATGNQLKQMSGAFSQGRVIIVTDK